MQAGVGFVATVGSSGSGCRNVRGASQYWIRHPICADASSL